MELTYATRAVRWAAASIVLSVVALVMAACASPADVTANHEREIRGYQDALRDAGANYRDDLANAREWNDHFMGVPAAGWIPILIFACVLAAILLGFGGYRVFNAFADRRQKQYGLEVEREKTLRARVERGACPVCGTTPLSVADRARLESET